MQLGTSLGLAFASGINAYLPLLAFSLSARYLNLYKVNPNFTFVTSKWFIIALVILTIIDFIADKIPVIDHTWDATHTIIRPIAGALVAAASSNQITIPTNTAAISTSLLSAINAITIDTHIAGVGLLVIAILGALLALMSHSAKATTRLISTFTTAGLFNAILSLGEDILVIITILLSLFLPIIMLILIILFLLTFGPLIIRTWNSRRRSGFI